MTHFIATNWLGRSHISFETAWKADTKLEDLEDEDLVTVQESRNLVHGYLEVDVVKKKLEPWLQGKTFVL